MISSQKSKYTLVISFNIWNDTFTVTTSFYTDNGKHVTDGIILKLKNNIFERIIQDVAEFKKQGHGSVTSVTFSKKGFSKGKKAEIIKLYSSLKKKKPALCGNKRLAGIKHYVLQP